MIGPDGNPVLRPAATQSESGLRRFMQREEVLSLVSQWRCPRAEIIQWWYRRYAPRWDSPPAHKHVHKTGQPLGILGYPRLRGGIRAGTGLVL